MGLSGCGSSDDPERSANPNVMATGMPNSFPVAALRLPGPPELLLAEGRHGIELTLAEYNAMVGRALLPADMDTLEARREMLHRIVSHKVVAAEGRLRGLAAPQAGSTLEEERQIARRVVQESVLEAQQTSDQEARAYFESHRELFPELDSDSLDNPGHMLHVKFTLHDERWRQRVEEWTEREKVIVHRDRFEALARTASTSVNSENEENES